MTEHEQLDQYYYTRAIVESEPDPELRKTLAKIYGHQDLINQTTEEEEDMHFNQFVRRPFAILAIEITSENIDEVAKLIGNLRTKDGVPYIALDRRIIPNITRAYIGWWITRLGDNYRCYAPKTFKAQFMAYSPEITFAFEELEDDDYDDADDSDDVEATDEVVS